MATTLDEVCDLALSHVTDYRLTTLYNSSGSSALNDYMEPWLLDSIDEFDVCDQALVYDTATQTFSVTLTQKNKNMLAHIMVRYWLEKEVNDVTQMRLHLQDRDFKTFAEANNLKVKLDLLNTKKEDISQRLSNYGFKNSVDWDQWDAQTFR